MALDQYLKQLTEGMSGIMKELPELMKKPLEEMEKKNPEEAKKIHELLSEQNIAAKIEQAKKDLETLKKY